MYDSMNPPRNNVQPAAVLRSFRVDPDLLPTLPEEASVLVRQGYLSAVPGRVVRVRIEGDAAWLGVRSAEGLDWSRELSLAEAEELLELACDRPVLRKRRWVLVAGGARPEVDTSTNPTAKEASWYLDRWEDDNEGLVLAVAVTVAGQDIELPEWAGTEVSEDPRFSPLTLMHRPYRAWHPAARQAEVTMPPRRVLSPRFEDALVWANRLHADQKRKGSLIPYVSHLMSVAGLVFEAGGDEEQAIAALLHDAVEDQGGPGTLTEIRRRFGERVARIVDACTDSDEEPKPPWRARKEAYVASIAHKPAEACLVSCADKLHNARAILADHRRVGEAVWDRFTGGKEGSLWYYRALVTEFRRAGVEEVLVGQLDAVVGELERG